MFLYWGISGQLLSQTNEISAKAAEIYAESPQDPSLSVLSSAPSLILRHSIELSIPKCGSRGVEHVSALLVMAEMATALFHALWTHQTG